MPVNPRPISGMPTHSARLYPVSPSERTPGGKRVRRFAKPVADIVWGPLAPLMADPDITDIVVYAHDKVYATRLGASADHELIAPAVASFATPGAYTGWLAYLLGIRQTRVREAAEEGRQLDLPGVRITLTAAHGMAEREVCLSMRLLVRGPQSLSELVEAGTLSGDAAAFLREMCLAGSGVLVTGGTGSGKTTLLRALLAELPGVSAAVDESMEIAGDTLDPARILLFRPSPSLATEAAIAEAAASGADRLVISEMRNWTASLVVDYGASGGQVLSTTHARTSPREAMGRLAELMAADDERVGQPDSALLCEAAQAFGVVVALERVPPVGASGIRRRAVAIDLVLPAPGDSDAGYTRVLRVFESAMSADGSHIEFSDVRGGDPGFEAAVTAVMGRAPVDPGSLGAAIRRIAERAAR